MITFESYLLGSGIALLLMFISIGFVLGADFKGRLSVQGWFAFLGMVALSWLGLAFFVGAYLKEVRHKKTLMMKTSFVLEILAALQQSVKILRAAGGTIGPYSQPEVYAAQTEANNLANRVKLQLEGLNIKTDKQTGE